MESTTSDVFKEPFRMSFTDTVYSNDTYFTVPLTYDICGDSS